MYAAFKHLHVLFVLISISLFLFRYVLLLIDSPLLKKKWLKIIPHINDTLLLLSAVGIMVTLSMYPIQVPWLTDKVIGVIAYIGFGVLAMKGKTAGARWIGFIGACGWIAFLLHVALSKQALIAG